MGICALLETYRIAAESGDNTQERKVRWIARLFGNEKREEVVSQTTTPSGIALTVTKVVTPPSPLQVNQCNLLKRATAFKRQQNLDEAICVLHEAFNLTRAGNLGMTVKELLRLGEYLVLAARYREAWTEFHKVAQLYYTPHWGNEPHARYSTMGMAYDSICNMQWERGKIEQAVAFGLTGYLLDRVVARISHETCPVERWNLKEGLADSLKILRHKYTPQQKIAVKSIVLKHLGDLKHPQPDQLMLEVFSSIGGQGDVMEFQE